MESKWKVHIFGDPAGTEWEISIVREDNKNGQQSWGWFGEDKLLVSHNGGPCHWPLAPGLGVKMIEIANQECARLNESQKKFYDIHPVP